MRNRNIVLASFLMVVIPFLITRLPFFLDYPVITIDPDYLHYYTIVDQVSKGFFPTFIIRTPGYPIFLKLIFTFFNSNMAVVVIQNILSLITALFFVFVIYRVYAGRWKYLPLTAAIGMAAFISSNNHLLADTSLLTESLFVNFTILFFAFLILALHYKTNRLWLMCSFILAFVILIRPVGMFLIVIFFIILVFLFRISCHKQDSTARFTRRLLHFIKKKETLSFSLPLVSILLLLSAYNYVTVGCFTFSSLYSEHGLISFTATFLQEKESFGPKINKIIARSKKKIRPRHKEVRDHSWNYKKVNRVLRRYYNRNRIFIFQSMLSLEEKDSYALYLKWRPLLSDMGWTAIKKHPVTYLKYLYSNLLFYFFDNMYDADFYNRLKGRYWKELTRKNYYEEFLSNSGTIRMYYKKAYAVTLPGEFVKPFLKENREPELSANIEIGNIMKKEFRINPTFLQRIHRVYKKLHDFLFRNIIWSFIFLFVLCFSLIRLVKSRFRHQGSLLLFTLTLSALAHGFIICMFSFAIMRYSYTMEFAYYLSLFLFPLILIPEPGEKLNQPIIND